MAMFRCGGEAPKPWMYLLTDSSSLHLTAVYSEDGINKIEVEDGKFWEGHTWNPSNLCSVYGGPSGQNTKRTVTLKERCYVKGAPNLPEGIYPSGTSFVYNQTTAADGLHTVAIIEIRRP